MRNLERLGNQFYISIPTDEEGFVGRECPVQECLGYFKIKPGTGLQGDDLNCYCPYCGHEGKPDQFFTPEQIEYAKSIAIRKITGAIRKDVAAWDRDLRRQTRNSFIKMSVQYQGSPQPIRYYREKQLETHVTCETCTLDYRIYGVFGYCPDCATHNSLQILHKNLELAQKELDLAATQETHDLVEFLIADALENAVAAFDGFGREACRIHASLATNPGKAENLSFQNLQRVDSRLQQLFGFKLSDGLPTSDWDFAHRYSQKRHLLAHKMGVVDQKYLDDTNDPQAVVGRKVPIAPDEVKKFIELLKSLGAFLANEMSNLTARSTGVP